MTNFNKPAFLQHGKLAEHAFADIFSQPSFSNLRQDQMEHWDVMFQTKVDVKGLKRVRRHNGEFDEHIHWLELKGITGHLGWVYGDADFFAFELNHYWIVVSKTSLHNFIKDNISKEICAAPTLYKLYNRYGRLDLLTLVTSYDLCSISSAIVRKNESGNRFRRKI